MNLRQLFLVMKTNDHRIACPFESGAKAAALQTLARQPENSQRREASGVRRVHRRFLMRLTTWFATASLILFYAAIAHAAIPEPDNILYGNITLDNTLVTADRTDVVIEARRQTNGPAIASYRMGSDSSLGNLYALKLAIESGTPITDTNSSRILDNLFIVVTDGTGVRAETTYTVADRGVAQRVDFGVAAVDSDGDGLPDAWELQQFTNLGQTPGSINANGMTALQNFIAGTDPNDPRSGFKLTIARTNNQKRVSFQAVRAEGPGYDGMTRLYTLESSPVLAGGSWSGVPSFTNISGDNQTVDYVASGTGGPVFFRGEITLQGFTLPMAGDSDGDGLPDAWETLHFGNLNQSANSPGPNGQTALQNFIAGNDPNSTNDVFKLTVTASGGNRMVSFLAVQAQGTGYEGRQRYYSLETSTNLGGTWSDVAGFSSILGNNQTQVYQPPNTAVPTFYRSRVWLQP
jgi:Bacterial TSP3 repeat